MGGVVRNTKQKQAIREVLQRTRRHPDADWVFQQVKKEVPDISLGTVYRNLRILKEAGAVQELISNGETSHFDGNTANHYHFRCDSCGRIFDIDEVVNKSIERRVAQKTGFKVMRHNLELSGLCVDCQNIKSLCVEKISDKKNNKKEKK
jgi:Fur family transcriptional regulator, peroxide stress response regulator